MNVSSLAFVGFALLVALIYNLARPVSWRQGVLLLANFAFLLTFSRSPLGWLPYAAFLLLGYVSHLLLRRQTHGSLFACVSLLLVLFFWLKKYTFLPSGLFLAYPYITLGLSYVLFRILHLLIDTYQGSLTVRLGPVTYLNYVLNFTAIISGPIQLFPDYASQQLTPTRPPLDIVQIGEALERIVVGYFKISILGLVFQTAQEQILGNLAHTAREALASRLLTAAALGVCYPLFLYFNFSGYTDVVIGLARGIRLTLPENFDRPFTAINFLDFWSRWHISLSLWLKTYVYSPLLRALMLRFPKPALIPYLGVFSFFVTFFLIGVWHGRTSVFVVFGVLQGLGVSLNKLFQIQMAKVLGRKGYKDLSAQPWYRALCRGLTFAYFCFSMVWFWSNWQQMDTILHSLGGVAILLGWLLVILAAAALITSYDTLRTWVLSIKHAGHPIVLSRYTRVAWGTTLAVLLAVVLSVFSVPAPQVVYRGF